MVVPCSQTVFIDTALALGAAGSEARSSRALDRLSAAAFTRLAGLGSISALPSTRLNRPGAVWLGNTGAAAPFHKRARVDGRVSRRSRNAVLIGYRRGAACFAMARTEFPYPVAEPRRWSLILARSKGPGDGEGIARDQARLARVAAGDEAAFAAIVAEETPRLLRFVAPILGSGQAEAEEIVQEALIRLWQQAEGWQPDGRISTWLHRVTYRLAIDVLRRRRPTVGIETVEDRLEDAGAGPVARIIQFEDVAALRAAIARLPERQRTAIALCHFQELGQAEAAAVMEIGEEAYESLLARARRRLRSLLAADDGRP